MVIAPGKTVTKLININYDKESIVGCNSAGSPTFRKILNFKVFNNTSGVIFNYCIPLEKK